MHIGEVIRAKRKERGLSQVELAQAAGISVNSLRLYEGGKREPRILTLDKIANALDSKLGEIAELSSIDTLAIHAILDRPANSDGKKPLTQQEQKQLLEIPSALLKLMHDLGIESQLQDICLEEFNKLNFLGKCTAIGLIQDLAQSPEYQVTK